MSALDELLLSLAGSPALPGARCRGKSHLFDGAEPGEDTTARYDQALGLCAACPALGRCSRWLDGLPARKRPRGVVAGRVVHANGQVI